MSRYIDADKIIYSWQIDLDGQEHDGVTLQSIINKIPSIDAVKHGRWINVDGTEKYGCSECKIIMWFSKRLSVKSRDYKFCPNCGARMDGERND